MNRQDLHIASPCHEDWAQMRPEDQRRFCAACATHVHDLTAMTEAQARALLDARPPEGFCIRYACWSDTGELIFQDPDAPTPPERAPVPLPLAQQRAGLQRLLAASALVLPLLGVGHAAQAQDAPPPPAASCDSALADAAADDDASRYDVFRLLRVVEASRALAHDTVRALNAAQHTRNTRRNARRAPSKKHLSKRDILQGFF